MLTATIPASAEEARYRTVFRRLHDGHDGCIEDEWLDCPCRVRGMPVAPTVWSRRNGPWRRVGVLLVGAAPGNAGGRGAGDMGAHGTRIPFGGDVAGANLDLLLGSAGLTRDDVFIAAALNRLPDGGGGEPALAEIARPAGAYPDSVAALRDTILAAGASLVVALGNVALRACVAAGGAGPEGGGVRLPGLRRLRSAGLTRGARSAWPDGAAGLPAVGADFRSRWSAAWDAPLPSLLWLTHPSAQNMSPHAGTETAFHRRMVEAIGAFRAAVEDTDAGRRRARARDGASAHRSPAPRAAARSAPGARAAGPTDRPSVYGTPEWRERVGPRHEALLDLWRRKGLAARVAPEASRVRPRAVPARSGSRG